MAFMPMPGARHSAPPNRSPLLYDEDMSRANAQLRVQGGTDAALQRDALGARLQEANINAGTALHGIDTGAATDRFKIGMDAETARRGQDQDFALGNRGLDVTTRGQDLDFKLGMAPIEWSKEKFGQIFPWVQGQLAAQGSGERVGGTPRPLPNITIGGVYSDQQTQQNVNAARAGIDQAAASQGARAATRLAGQGFGRRSPLLAALQQQIQGQAMAAGADAERGIRHDASTANADQRLRSEALSQQQWKDFEDQDIRRLQVASNDRSALLSLLAPLLG